MADSTTPNDVSHEDLRPQFLSGEGGCALYTCLHLPIGASRHDLVAVICQPAGHEYERSHRAVRQLAAQLAQSGVPALRFDYVGSGDSSGDPSTASPRSWPDDLRTVIAHGKEISKTTRLALIGLRFGALLAANQAIHAEDCTALVLWHPVRSGPAMLSEWDRLQEEYARAIGHVSNNPSESILGWTLGPEWRDAFATFGKCAAPPAGLPALLIKAPETEGTLAAQDWQCTDGLEVYEDESGRIWLQDAMDAIVPLTTIRRIANWLSEV